MNPFTALGLTPGPGLTDEDVRAAWRSAAAATHPDRADGGNPAAYAAAAAAYEQLRAPWGRSEQWPTWPSCRTCRPPRPAPGGHGTRSWVSPPPCLHGSPGAGPTADHPRPARRRRCDLRRAARPRYRVRAGGHGGMRAVVAADRPRRPRTPARPLTRGQGRKTKSLRRASGSRRGETSTSGPCPPPSPGQSRRWREGTSPPPLPARKSAPHGLIQKRKAEPKAPRGNGQRISERVSRETDKLCLSWENSLVIHCRQWELTGLSAIM